MHKKIKVMKIVEHAIVPNKGSKGAGGLDLTAIDHYYNHDRGYHEYGTGLSIEVPEGYVGKLYARSSVSDTGLFLANGVGIIDSDYRGEIKFRFKVINEDLPVYEVGDRVGQLIIEPVETLEMETVTELSSTERNAGGFGSTGQ